MTADPRPRVVLVDGIPMSGLVAQAKDPRAVIVAVHGGGTSAAYFDCPGRPELSLLRSAVTAGVTAIALDRPGYGASALHQQEFLDAERRVASAFGAVDKMLSGGRQQAPLFLVGHSAGCELAVRMAVSDRSDEVVGLSISGTGLRYCTEALAIIKDATLTSRPSGLRDLLWEPTELYPPEVLTGALSAPGAHYEAKVTANWPRRDFRELAARVTAPVQFSVAEHEKVWESTPQANAEILTLFSGAQRVELNEMPDSGHNLSVGLSAEQYHQRVLAYLDECLSAAGGAIDNREVEAG